MKAISLFVVQRNGCAPDPTGSAKTKNVSPKSMCVMAETSVPTVPTKQTAVSW